MHWSGYPSVPLRRLSSGEVVHRCGAQGKEQNPKTKVSGKYDRKYKQQARVDLCGMFGLTIPRRLRRQPQQKVISRFTYTNKQKSKTALMGSTQLDKFMLRKRSII
ncbi:hypothetical protein NDU88_005680 [Pleurodeles waltl]|uniref:Uncharacterized protein n=1 Tax=Pleurodeles waltl TaxID=8319 RepID=A0AAV7SMD1_PLEWA|nr:hypothetical protein NDU88_005680 [Pleurodeles waltl]